MRGENKYISTHMRQMVTDIKYRIPSIKHKLGQTKYCLKISEIYQKSHPHAHNEDDRKGRKKSAIISFFFSKKKVEVSFFFFNFSGCYVSHFII